MELRPVVSGKLTLKTRVGFETPDEFDDLLELFASLPIDGLAIHGRTVRERYQSPVHTDCIARAVEVLPFPVTANGSIISVETGLAVLEKTKAAGLMIGRGGIRDPWLFEAIRAALRGERKPQTTLRDVCEYILELSDEISREEEFDNDTQLVHRMKKFTNYIASGIHEGALSHSLRRCTTLTDFQKICREHLKTDELFPIEPPDDGKLFCGFRELVTG